MSAAFYRWLWLQCFVWKSSSARSPFVQRWRGPISKTVSEYRFSRTVKTEHRNVKHRKLEYFHFYKCPFLLLSLVPFFKFLPKSCLVPTSNNAFHTNSLYSKCTLYFVRKKYSFVQLNTVYNQWLVSYCVQTSFLLHFDLEYLTNKLVSTTCGDIYCMILGI